MTERERQRDSASALRDERIAYLGLGGNLGSKAQLQARFAATLGSIRSWPETLWVRASGLYWTDPVGPVRNQPRFLNSVVSVSVQGRLGAESLLHRLHAIEDEHGRDREGVPAQGPRTLDLDLLLYADQVCRSAFLTLPHPRMQERSFVLVPLCELAGRALRIPGRGSLGELLDALLGAASSPGPPRYAGEIAPVAVDDHKCDRDSQRD